MELEHEEMRSLLALYALGALPLDELQMVSTHLLHCEECRGETKELSELTASLALVVDPVPLPAGFADRVVSAARGEEAVVGTRRSLSLVDADTAPVSEPRDELAERRSRRRWNPAAVLAAAAMLLIVSVLSMTLLDARRELGRTETAVAALASNKGMALEGSGAQGRIVPGGDGSLMVIAGLDAAPSERDYQLWLMRDGEPVSAGVFDVSEGVVTLSTELELDGYDGAAITVEPQGGSDQPTTEPIVTSA